MLHGKPLTEIIPQRFSCRSYEKTPIDDEKRRALADFVAADPTGPFGSPTRFRLIAATDAARQALRGLGTYGFIRDPAAFVVGAVGQGHRSLEDYGHAMERIVLFATALGLGTCWLGGSFTKSRFAGRIAAGEGEAVPAVVSVGRIPQRRGLVDRMMRRVAGGAHRLPWERLFFLDRFGAPLSRQQAGPYATALEMVRLAPSASNKQPWRVVRAEDRWHFYLHRTPGYRTQWLSRLLDVADMQRIDLGIAMSHFELTADELGLPGAWEIEPPSISKPDASTEYVATWTARR